uniref:DNA-directed RNA polymerase III subunit RPC4 n=1 Tax=Pectinophora gossypiella TaxID=13191 RepID=A0A1E1WQH3_PECGO
MSNPEENASRTKSAAIDPMARLATFKPPRDYTLGGPKPNKKIFTPNLNVSRNKSKGLSTTKEQKKEDKSKRDRKNDRNGNLWNKNIVKSDGVFSEGMGSAARHSFRGSQSRNAESATSVLKKPTIRVKDVIKIDKELEEQKIKAAVSRGTLPNDDSENFKDVFDKNAPVKLPMENTIHSYKLGKANKHVTIKTEPEEPAIQNETKPMPSIKKEVYEDTNLVDLLNSTEPKLLLVQLPDTLPGRSAETEESSSDRKPNEQQCPPAKPDEESKPENKCNLKQLEEGKIGKLLVHRSGKVTLMLGNTSFEVSLGTKPAFHQEVVSMAADEASRSASIVSLGPVQHKLNIVPDWETMFANVP